MNLAIKVTLICVCSAGALLLLLPVLPVLLLLVAAGAFLAEMVRLLFPG